MQLSRAELKNMPPGAVKKALAAGQFTDLLFGNDPGGEPRPQFEPPEGTGDQGKRFTTPAEWLRSLEPEELCRLLHEGLLDPLLRGEQ